MNELKTVGGVLDCPVVEIPDAPINIGAVRLSVARTDVEAISGWLAEYKDSPHTFAAYKREAERLMTWCRWRQLGLQQLMVEHLREYRDWLADPQPTEMWCLQQAPRMLPNGQANPAWRQVQREKRELPDGSPNPAWRPFVSGLSAAGVRQSMTIVFGLFEYLCAIGWLGSNPGRALKQRRARNELPTERWLDKDAWHAVERWLADQEESDLRAAVHAARNRFVIRFLFLTGLRRQELVSARTSDFVIQRGKWWMRVTGKGLVASQIPINADAIAAVQQYRQVMGRPPIPTATQEPLILTIGGKKGVSDDALYKIVRNVMTEVADSQRDPALAQLIRKASVHWLRHSFASHALDSGMSLISVQKGMRHSNIATTSRYLHKDLDEQHAEQEKHKLEVPNG